MLSHGAASTGANYQPAARPTVLELHHQVADTVLQWLLVLLLQVHDGTYTPADQFVKDPDSLCSTVTWKDEEDRVIWVYRIQVGPAGFVVIIWVCKCVRRSLRP
jgi:hypothetical protein